MVVEWFDNAQLYWIEQLEYCAKSFGDYVASDFIKKADEKLTEFVDFPIQELLSHC